MKLFQKICLQIFLAMLVLAAGMLWFLVWEMQRQNAAAIAEEYGVKAIGVQCDITSTEQIERQWMRFFPKWVGLIFW